MDAGLIIAIAFALAFALTNGFHDAANAIATLVATRGATPARAIALSSVFNLLGAKPEGARVLDLYDARKVAAGMLQVMGL